MKYLAAITFFFILHTSSFILSARAQSVGISIAIPDNSALLELVSTTQGFLAPRMSGAAMLLISSPAAGDLVYNTTASTFYYFNGSIWVPIAGGLDWSLTGNSGTSPSTNFLGTIDGEDLVQKTNSTEHLRVFNGSAVGLTNTNNISESLIFFEQSDTGTRYTAFKAGIQTTTPHYIWPLGGDGLPNQALVTDGAGNLSWHTFATFGGSGSQSLWKRGSAAGGEYSDSTGSSDSGPYSIAAGFHTKVTGNYEIVFGDSTSGVSGSYGAVNGGSGNSSTGDKDVTGGGQDNSASATSSYIGGGSSNSTSGDEEVVLGGQKNSFSGSNSTIIGGYNNKTSCNQELLYGDLGATAGTCASVVFKIGTHTLMGINTVSPTEAMDVVGNVKFSGALKPNGSGGSSGNYLLSAGAGVYPTWGSIVVPSTSWRLTGNIGTNPSINFIGTTDATAFVMRTNATEAMRIQSTGQVSINTTTSAHQLQSFLTGTTNETAAIYGNASGATTAQALGVWGRANTSASNTGTLSVLATGSGNTTSGSTNVALQLNQGEFAMGRDTLPPSSGTAVEPAASGVLYSQHGPSGVIQVQLSDLSSTTPVTGVYLDLGDVTINNEYIASTSIILAGVIAKINNSGTTPDPINGIYKVDVESRTTGSCVIHIGMIPTVTGANGFHTQCFLRIGYIVINPGR
ncbi:MAG TPA: hypothetical protein VFH95_03680 [Candidatus Kapabacteria bacterium]|nr:hypothetical protein [Candidatus Kapabacteria bacterium]